MKFQPQKEKASSELCSDLPPAVPLLLRGLHRYLDDNCFADSYYSDFKGALRNRDFPRCYALAESLSTEVFGDARSHLRANQLAAMLLKTTILTHEQLGFESTPRQAAEKKFFASESKCARTNRFFGSNRWMFTPHAVNIYRMQNWIRRVIGDEPNLPAIFSKCGFSSGANVGVNGDATHLGMKLSKRWSCTPSALSYFRQSVGYNFHLTEYLLRSDAREYICFDNRVLSERLEAKVDIVTSNKISFVPKTAKTDRSIAVEPLCNAYLQKGVDNFFRERLRRVGYDLTDQTLNQRLARLGSIDNSFATIDLSSASDTISTQLVKVLLPPAWFEFLNGIRSPSYGISGKVHTYQKFVSMGNGFCFPLETMIFAAAVQALSRGANAVYGDDIIVLSDVASRTIKLLKHLGFRPNVAKTFVRGPFRESCGADWYKGQDVRPVYVDNQLTEVSHLMVAHNSTLRSEQVADLLKGWRENLLGACPEKLRFLRPPYGAQEQQFRWSDPRVTNGAFTVPLDIFMGCRFARFSRHEHRWTWREHLYVPVDDKRFPDDCLERYFSFLSGSLGGSLNLRYTTKRLSIIK